MEIDFPKRDYLRIKVIPKSTKTEISEILKDGEGEETIKIKLRAIPEKGKANKELINFLAKYLAIDPSRISIISGHHDQLKLVKIAWQ